MRGLREGARERDSKCLDDGKNELKKRPTQREMRTLSSPLLSFYLALSLLRCDLYVCVCVCVSVPLSVQSGCARIGIGRSVV